MIKHLIIGATALALVHGVANSHDVCQDYNITTKPEGGLYFSCRTVRGHQHTENGTIFDPLEVPYSSGRIRQTERSTQGDDIASSVVRCIRSQYKVARVESRCGEYNEMGCSDSELRQLYDDLASADQDAARDCEW